MLPGTLSEQPFCLTGGEDEDRTHDLYIANVALSQLSYPPDQDIVYQQSVGDQPPSNELSADANGVATQNHFFDAWLTYIIGA
jgi:hypothetical protein